MTRLDDDRPTETDALVASRFDSIRFVRLQTGATPHDQGQGERERGHDGGPRQVHDERFALGHLTDRLDDGGVRRRGARDGGDDARRGGRHHNLYARENTRARARVVSHAFALARASAARPAPTESSNRRVVTHRVLSIHIRHPIASDPSMHRARARPMPPSSIARSRARISSDVFLARRLVLLLVVVARPSSVDVDRVLARALARRARARPAGRTNDDDDDDDRTIDRTRATRRTLFFSAHPRRVRRVPRVGARALASSIHPSTRARDRSDPGADRIEIVRTFCSLVVSAARATTTRPVRRLEFAVALTARVSRACVIARVVANIVGVCRPRARATGARDGRGGSCA